MMRDPGPMKSVPWLGLTAALLAIGCGGGPEGLYIGDLDIPGMGTDDSGQVAVTSLEATSAYRLDMPACGPAMRWHSGSSTLRVDEGETCVCEIGGRASGVPITGSATLEAGVLTVAIEGERDGETCRWAFEGAKQ